MAKLLDHRGQDGDVEEAMYVRPAGPVFSHVALARRSDDGSGSGSGNRRYCRWFRARVHGAGLPRQDWRPRVYPFFSASGIDGVNWGKVGKSCRGFRKKISLSLAEG